MHEIEPKISHDVTGGFQRSEGTNLSLANLTKNDAQTLSLLDAQQNKSVLSTSAGAMLNGFSLNDPSTTVESQANKIIAGRPVCENGWMSVYKPTGDPKALGGPYTGNEEGVAIDPRGPFKLGGASHITNLENGRDSHQFNDDTGPFRFLDTPDGKPRVVDATIAVFHKLTGRDDGMVRVRVCSE